MSRAAAMLARRAEPFAATHQPPHARKGRSKKMSAEPAAAPEPTDEDRAHWDVMEDELDAMEALDRELGTGDTAPPDASFWIEQKLARPLADDYAYEDFLPVDVLEDRFRLFIVGVLPEAHARRISLFQEWGRLPAANQQQVARDLGLHRNDGAQLRGAYANKLLDELRKANAPADDWGQMLDQFSRASLVQMAVMLRMMTDQKEYARRMRTSEQHRLLVDWFMQRPALGAWLRAQTEAET